MKNIRLKLFSFFLATIGPMSLACEAIGESQANGISFEGKRWQMQKFTVSPSIDWDLNGVKDTDIFELLEPCERDDLMILRENGTVVRAGGDEKCDEDEEPEWEDGTWKYDTIKGILILTTEGKEEVFKVVAVSTGKLTLEHHFKSTKGEDHILTAVYSVKK